MQRVVIGVLVVAVAALMAFTVITESGHLRDVDTTDRADGRTWVWDEDTGSHIYVPLPEGGGGEHDHDDDYAPLGHDHDAQARRLIVDDAMTTWWMLPRAVTFQGNIYTGGVAENGDIVVHSTRPDEERQVLGSFEQDDHNGVSLLVEPDHGPIVFYTRHSLDDLLRYRKGTRVGDLSSLGAEQTIDTGGGTTYAQVWRTPGTDTLHVATRSKDGAGDNIWKVYRSDDFGDTWDSGVTLLTGDRPYIGSVQAGETVRVAAAQHPTEEAPEVRYLEIHLASGDITNADGTVIANLDGTSLPRTISSLETVYTAPSGHGVRLMALSSGPNPDIAVATWTDDHDTVYRVAEYDGTSWDDSEVVEAGKVIGFIPSTHYNAGVAFPDPTDGNELLVAREADDVWFMERWVKGVDGWTLTQRYDESSETMIARPWPSVGGGFVYHRVGDYPWYDTYEDASVWGVMPPIVPGAHGGGVEGEFEPAGAVDEHNTDPHAHGALTDTGHRLVVLHDFGSGLEPVTDDEGRWLYGAFPGPRY